MRGAMASSLAPWKQVPPAAGSWGLGLSCWDSASPRADRGGQATVKGRSVPNQEMRAMATPAVRSSARCPGVPVLLTPAGQERWRFLPGRRGRVALSPGPAEPAGTARTGHLQPLWRSGGLSHSACRARTTGASCQGPRRALCVTGRFPLQPLSLGGCQEGGHRQGLGEQAVCQ